MGAFLDQSKDSTSFLPTISVQSPTTYNTKDLRESKLGTERRQVLSQIRDASAESVLISKNSMFMGQEKLK